MKLKSLMMLSAGLWFSACGMPVEGEAGADDNVIDSEDVDFVGESLLSSNGLSAINGLSATNGLAATNGLSAVNGLSALNGLSAVNGLSATNGLMTSAPGRKTVEYLVRCALRSDQTITKVVSGVSYSFKGQIGIAPEWANGACGKECQESVSACMLAHVNTTGQNIQLWLDGNVPGIGWGQSTGYPYQEGSFFGNIFKDQPEAYYCNGRDFDQGVVPGRLGANQSGAPYKVAYVGAENCDKFCTAMDRPYQDDGYKACNGFNFVVTVWRNFDANTNYKICNRANGRCLDATDSSVQANSYTGASAQKWKILQVNAKQYKVVNVASGKVLTVAGKSKTNGTPIVHSTYVTNASDQLWSFTSMANNTGFHALSPVLNPTSVISLPSASSGQNAVAQEQAWNAAATQQQWTIAIAN